MEWLSPWIHTTDKCNMACSYCFVQGNRVMEQPVYDALEKMLLTSGAKRYNLRFAGGEPLLVFDKWKNFAERMLAYPQTHIEVLTNLYYIPDGFVSFAERDRVNLSVSLDAGSKYKMLYDGVLERLSRVQKQHWIMTTLTEDNINDLTELADMIGSRKYGWSISTDYFWAGKPAVNDLIVALIKAIRILQHHSHDFRNFTFNNAGIGSYTGCCAGDLMFSVDCNGDISPCQTLNQKVRIGSVFTGYSHTERCTHKICENCSAKGFCSGWCPLYHKPGSELCKAIKFVVYEVLKGADYAK